MTDGDFIKSAFAAFGPKLFSGLSPAEVFHDLRLRNQRQMAACMGLSLDVFERRVAEGTLPKPEIKLGRRAFYTEEQASRIEGGALEIGEAHSKTSEEHVHKETRSDGTRTRRTRRI
jgi:predicted DNA-binding transcriptional regulator AlpA